MTDLYIEGNSHMMVVFLRTLSVKESPDVRQAECGRLTLIDGKLVAEGDLDFTDTFLRQPRGRIIDPSDLEAVKAAMRDAPRRFDGSRLRAQYVPGISFTLGE